MPNSIFVLLFIVGISFGMLHAVLMLVSPEKHRRFNFWLTTLGGRSNLKLDEQQLRRGFELSYRAAGLIGVCVCADLVWAGVNKLLDARRYVMSTEPTQLPLKVGVSWLPFVGGLTAIAIGIYFRKRPKAAYLWSIKGLPIRRDKLPDNWKLRRGMGLFGLCFIGFGLLALWFGIYNLIQIRGGH